MLIFIPFSYKSWESLFCVPVRLFFYFLNNQEREKIREEEERKQQKARRELEAQLNMKEMQLQEMFGKQTALEGKLDIVCKEVPEIRDENLHLTKERDFLQRY